MKLASLKSGRDGKLILVNKALTHYAEATDIASTLQAALDNWADISPQLSARAQKLERNELEQFPFDASQCSSPLPRAYHWCDASAYVNHVELVRKARNAEMPASFWTDPLMYQGGSDCFIGPRDPFHIADESWGVDFEAEVAIVLDDVPMGVSVDDAGQYILLLMLVNDISLRHLIPNELAKGFGFYQAKPSSAFSPIAATLNEVAPYWHEGKLHLPLQVTLNDKLIGSPNAGIDMTFSFPQLIAHAAKSRPLCAGTIIGSGTVSNVDRSQGSCCLAEVRMLETIADGEPHTEFMHYGDCVSIDMHNTSGQSIFGQIHQRLEPYAP